MFTIPNMSIPALKGTNSAKNFIGQKSKLGRFQIVGSSPVGTEANKDII